MSGNSKGNGESYGYTTQTESRNTRNFARKNPSYGRTFVLTTKRMIRDSRPGSGQVFTYSVCVDVGQQP